MNHPAYIPIIQDGPHGDRLPVFMATSPRMMFAVIDLDDDANAGISALCYQLADIAVSTP